MAQPTTSPNDTSFPYIRSTQRVISSNSLNLMLHQTTCYFSKTTASLTSQALHFLLISTWTSESSSIVSYLMPSILFGNKNLNYPFQIHKYSFIHNFSIQKSQKNELKFRRKNNHLGTFLKDWDHNFRKSAVTNQFNL